uniref:Nudix hydrolase domain-containing protein n=1 Tax=viral metagenome TaxID=1070528 RepID=A0A6C0JTT5_9ZZZZ
MLLTSSELVKLRGCIRSGVIPYVKKGSTIKFLMGVDKRHKELSDFGGGVKLNETVIQAGKRELFEEVKELICDDDIGDVKVGIYDRHNSTCVLFCEIVNIELAERLQKEFIKTVKHGDEYNEMSSLVWISTNDMIRLVYSSDSFGKYNMWNRIKFTLLNSGEFDDRLLALL